MSSGFLVSFGRLERRRAAAVGLVTALLLLLAALFAGQALALETLPANSGEPPTANGNTTEGKWLKAAHGNWTGGGLTYAYRWQRCEPDCSNIPGANGQEYKLVYADVGAGVRVVVTASNKVGSTEAASAQKVPIAGVAPKNRLLPVIHGEAMEGQLLTVDTGAWEGSPALAYTYQWERCKGSKCAAIEGATEAGYRPAEADVGSKLRAIVTDINVAGTKSATSNETGEVVHGPPHARDFPAISGALRVGQTLTGSSGTWDGQPTFEYAWESCNSSGECTNTAGQSYPLSATDAGNRIRLTVTATNSHGTGTASSVATTPVLSSEERFVAGWGEDLHGQLATIYRTMWEESPVREEVPTSVSAIAQGGSFALELQSNGTVTASGAGIYGSIGYGGRKASWEQGKSYVTVKGLSHVTKISAGGEYATALLEDGTVWAWGNNAYGILGNGRGGWEKETGENQLEPKEVKALKGKGVQVLASGGGANFAILPGGKVEAWGHNMGGELGVATPAECQKINECELSRKHPIEDPTEATWKCFVETGWELCSKIPRPVEGVGGTGELEGVKEIAAGGEATYALLEGEGEVLSWGSASGGALGQEQEWEKTPNFRMPAPVMINATERLKHVVAISAGHRNGLALTESGQVYGWGSGGSALGEPVSVCHKKGGATYPCDRYATLLAGLEGVHVQAIASGWGNSVALTTDGHVYAVGANEFGQLGRGPGCENEGGKMGVYEPCFSNVWKAVPGLEHVEAISAGSHSLMALVGREGLPPAPVVGIEAQSKALKLEWGLRNGESSESLVYRAWEHSGEFEAGEGEGEGAEPPEEPNSGPPLHTTPPMIKPYVYNEEKKRWETVHTEVAVGQTLKATSLGTWFGAQPMSFKWQWLSCEVGAECTPIPGAGGTYVKESSEPEYVIRKQDARHMIALQITAENGVEPYTGTATSDPTETVKAEGEGRSSKAEKVGLEPFDDGYAIGGLGESPQYEVKLNTEAPAPSKGKTRIMVLTPLP
jgi:alpha-tubulin suppressor-like RCC1 family protein